MTVNKFLLSLALVAAVVACSDDDATDPAASIPNVVLNATSGSAYAALGNPPTTVSVGDPSTSTTWDIAIVGLDGAINSNAKGISAYCLCKNQSKTDAQILALTANDGAVAFNAVTAADIPTDDDLFQEDAEQLAIDEWYTYNPVTHGVSANPDAVYAIRLASTSTLRAKFHVTNIVQGSSQDAPADITIEWATGTNATFSASQTKVVTTSSSAPQYVNLTTGVVTTTPTGNWDIVIKGYEIRVNGDANAAAILLPETMTYATVDITGMPSSIYEKDGTGGVFIRAPWYRYNIDAANPHRMTPTFDVYLVKKGSEVYKVQFASFYHPTTGDSYYITLRAAKLK